jgi:hypothetical protein
MYLAAPPDKMDSLANLETSSTRFSPASDFSDLVDSILQLNVASIQTHTQLIPLRRRHDRLQVPSGSSERRVIAAQIVSMARVLENQYQELDKHYGWVLASDHALVGKVLRSYFGENEVGHWLSKVNVHMAKTRSTLREIIVQFGEGAN